MDYRRTYVRDLFSLAPGTQTSAYGWVKTRRDSKGISFVQLSDGSCFKDLQVIFNEGVVPPDTLKQITTLIRLYNLNQTITHFKLEHINGKHTFDVFFFWRVSN
jgi:aspartyl/asparaginyl-tRNA synthetase